MRRSSSNGSRASAPESRVKTQRAQSRGSSRSATGTGPSQRQLRAGEIVRHALSDILAREEFLDPDLAGLILTLAEVRMSPDLKHAHVFVAPLQTGQMEPARRQAVLAALNRAGSFFRGQLGRLIEMKYTPQLRFLEDDSQLQAARIDALLAQPHVVQDLAPGADEASEPPAH